MATKSQHSRSYRPLMELLRALREEAELTQRDLGELLGRPHSWVHNCEVGNRRVDVAEFVSWTSACGVEPTAALARFLGSSTPRTKPGRKQPRKENTG